MCCQIQIIDALSVVRVERKKPNTIASFVRILKQREPSTRWELAVYFYVSD